MGIGVGLTLRGPTSSYDVDETIDRERSSGFRMLIVGSILDYLFYYFVFVSNCGGFMKPYCE